MYICYAKWTKKTNYQKVDIKSNATNIPNEDSQTHGFKYKMCQTTKLETTSLIKRKIMPSTQAVVPTNFGTPNQQTTQQSQAEKLHSFCKYATHISASMVFFNCIWLACFADSMRPSSINKMVGMTVVSVLSTVFFGSMAFAHNPSQETATHRTD